MGNPGRSQLWHRRSSRVIMSVLPAWRAGQGAKLVRFLRPVGAHGTPEIWGPREAFRPQQGDASLEALPVPGTGRTTGTVVLADPQRLRADGGQSEHVRLAGLRPVGL